MIRNDDERTLRDAGILVPHHYADEISDRALYVARRRIERRGTPRVIQALPMKPLNEARARPSCLPSVIVGTLVLGFALLEGVVPNIAGAIAAAMP